MSEQKPERNNLLFEAYSRENLSLGQLAARFDISRERCRQILVKAGVETRNPVSAETLQRMRKSAQDLKDLVAEIKTLRAKLAWIPVSERLPENTSSFPKWEKNYYLVTDAKDRTASAYLCEYSKTNLQWVSGKAIGEVVAWMELPESFAKQKLNDIGRLDEEGGRG